MLPLKTAVKFIDVGLFRAKFPDLGKKGTLKKNFIFDIFKNYGVGICSLSPDKLLVFSTRAELPWSGLGCSREIPRHGRKEHSRRVTFKGSFTNSFKSKFSQL